MVKEVLTPWEVSGEVNYSRLIQEFGLSPLPEQQGHPLVSRGFYYAHRDFQKWQDNAKKGKASILTGRGPSEKLHIGHLIPFILAKHFQEQYNCEVFIPLSEDEKFFVKKDLSLENAKKFAEDNIKDILALGFKKGKTFIIRDFSYPSLYENSAKIAKLLSYTKVKAVFGLEAENNIGWSFYPAVQAFHILLPQFTKGKHHTLVPVGIDQDPFIRLTRDIAEHPSLNFNKPSAIYSKFMPGLKGNAKMSSSDSENDVIFLSDSPNQVKSKINKYAFSGGKDTLEEHRKHGGNPDIDISFQYLKMFFEPNDKELKIIERKYKSGELLSGELKAILIEKVNTFLKKHQENKAKIKEISKFMLN